MTMSERRASPRPPPTDPRHPLEAALAPMQRRVSWRHGLRWLQVGVLVGLAGAVPGALAARWFGGPEPVAVAAGWFGLAVAAALGWALWRRPDLPAAARAADSLGLAERVASALHARATGYPAAPLLAADAVRALAAVEPRAYPIVTAPRRWALAAVGMVAVVVALVAPLPELGDFGRRAAEARAVAEARQMVRAIPTPDPLPPAPDPLARATADELRALDEALAQAASAAEAARALEAAQERLAGSVGAEDHAWRRAAEALAATWQGRGDLGQLARALARQDPAAVDPALADLDRRFERMSDPERQDLALALQAGANATRNVPELAGALRQAAASTGTQGSTSAAASNESGAADGETSAAGGSGALGSLGAALSQAAGRSASVSAAQSAVATVGQARAGVCPPGSACAVANGAPAGSAGRASISAAARGSGSGGAAATGGNAGSGTGSGSSTGNSSGSGQAGGGTGAGAGAGGGPAPGRPGAANAGLTEASAAGRPSDVTAVPYEPIYAPSLLGGEGGQDAPIAGDAAGARGETVELPRSPLDLGAVRPYHAVFGQYEAAARESLARQPLPPALQGLVQRYFSAITPEPR